MSGDPVEAQTLTDLVAYQEGSIVSRKLLAGRAGSVTLFAFAEGESLSEHTTPYDALVSVLEGTARVTIEGRPFDVEAGQAIVLPANRPHAVEATTRFKMSLTMLRS